MLIFYTKKFFDKKNRNFLSKIWHLSEFYAIFVQKLNETKNILKIDLKLKKK
jgi:hypothetical protein